MIRRILRAAAALLLLQASPIGRAAAQDSAPVEFVTAVPDAPAYTFLTVSPSQIQRPGTLRDLGVALLNGIGADGQAQQGFALDATTWTLVPGLSIGLERYRTSPLAYMLANTQLSLATARSSGTGSDTDVALGVHITLLDRGDPMRDPAVTDRLGTDLLTCAPDQPGEELSLACVDSVTATAFASYTQEHWLQPRLSVATAVGGTFLDSDVRRSRSAGVEAWAVGALPILSRGQLVAQARVGQRPERDSIPAFCGADVAARLVLGSGTFNLFAEVVGEHRSFEDEPLAVSDGGGLSWSGGLEFRMMPNTWVSTGFGSQYGVLGEPDRTLVFGHIRWGITSVERIGDLQ